MINLGDKIDNRYRIVEHLGSGGMADVFLANDIVCERYVAIKIIKDSLLGEKEILDSFKEEAKISASMYHENIVAVYDEGVYQNCPYIVIEYMREQTLLDKLDYLTKFSVDEAISIMIQLLDAIIYTHDHHLIHRDIKPQNVFYLSNGTVKLGDFGIATNEKAIGGKVIGSVSYIAPEVLKGLPFSVRSDVYAAGITFYQLITGKLPFEGRPEVVIVDQQKKPMPLPSKNVIGLEKEIDYIILKATSKNPGDRYLDAREFKNDLISFQNGTFKKESFFSKLMKKI